MSRCRDRITAAAGAAISSITRQADAGQSRRSESSDAAIWLVGLSVTLTGVILALPNAMAAWPVWARQIMLVLFLCTIVLGVLNRIISVHAISAWNLLQEELRGYVLGFAEGLRDDPLPELSDTWSAPELVGRMKSEFGLDLELLLDRQVPLEVFRETYRREWASWQEYETRLASQLIGSSLAYLGLSEEQLMKRACVGAGPEAQRSRVRSHARRVTRAMKLAVWCFTLSGICFLMAVSVGVLVLLGRP